jgi:hypothetical protein
VFPAAASGQPGQPARQVPVAVSEQGHGGGEQHLADDRGVEQHGDGEADADDPASRPRSASTEVRNITTAGSVGTARPRKQRKGRLLRLILAITVLAAFAAFLVAVIAFR